MSYKEYNIQLMDHVTGEVIATSGGVCFVAQDGTSAKQTLYSDKNGTSLSNPLTLTRGNIGFFVADTVNLVDLYIEAPGGQFVVMEDVAPMGPNEIFIDTGRKDQVQVIPFDHADITANTETDTGFDTGTNKVYLPWPYVKVVDVDTSETIDVGSDAGFGNDPNGFIAALSVATAGTVLASNETGVDTLGALLTVNASATLQAQPAPPTGSSGDISITTSAGSDTGGGFIYLPYRLG